MADRYLALTITPKNGATDLCIILFRKDGWHFVQFLPTTTHVGSPLGRDHIFPGNFLSFSRELAFCFCQDCVKLEVLGSNLTSHHKSCEDFPKNLGATCLAQHLFSQIQPSTNTGLLCKVAARITDITLNSYYALTKC